MMKERILSSNFGIIVRNENFTLNMFESFLLGSTINEKMFQNTNGTFGCITCCKVFDSKDLIIETTDKSETKLLCPVCGNRSVITDACGLTLSEELLNGFKSYLNRNQFAYMKLTSPAMFSKEN